MSNASSLMSLKGSLPNTVEALKNKMKSLAEQNKTLDGSRRSTRDIPRADYRPNRSRSTSRSRQSVDPPPPKRQQVAANIPTMNSFDQLEEMDIDSQTNATAQRMRPPLKQKADALSIKSKPIVAFKTTNEVIQRYLKEIDVKCYMSKLGKDSYKIQPNNIADKKRVCEKLTACNVEHHTYTETSDRKSMYVLKGLDAMEPLAVEALLLDNEILVSKVTPLSKSSDYPSYLVSFEKSAITLNELTNRHSILGYTKVKWEKLQERNRRPTQCRNCQAWGHAASNCKRKYRCVKCLVDHGPNQCPRTDENKKDSPPSCVNCNKVGHLSSSYKCEAFIKYDEKIQRRRPVRRQRQFVSNTQTNWNDMLDFESSFPPFIEPSARPAPHHFMNSYANVTRTTSSQNPRRESRSNLQNIEEVQDELNAISGLDEAFDILRELTRKLKCSTSALEKARVLFNFMNTNNGF